MSPQELISKLTLERKKVAVIGDVLVDIYHYGRISKINQEFPIPILKSNKHQPIYLPGGAGNVCYQLKNFNCSAALFGLVDIDVFKELQFPLNIDTSGCVFMKEGRVPRKVRFYTDDDFPMLRWDIESESYGEKDLSKYRDELFKRIKKRISLFDIVIFSNYAKGVFDKALCQKIINLCRKEGVPTICDPKNNPDWWCGCNYFKPNQKEALEMTGLNGWHRQAEQLKKSIKCDAVIITKEGSGVSGMDEKGLFDFFNAGAVEKAVSVVGAGDCYISVLAILLAHGINVREASQIAFQAGTIYVKEKHNRPIHPYELYQKLDPVKSKIIKDPRELVNIKSTCFDGLKFVFTNGVFDILGTHHLSLLKFAKAHGDKLIVAVNGDASVKRLKGDSRPINSLEQRMESLSNLEGVDFVVPFHADTPHSLIQWIRPDLIVKGGDYTADKVVGADLVGQDKVIIFPYLENHSTTSTIEKIKSKLAMEELTKQAQELKMGY